MNIDKKEMLEVGISLSEEKSFAKGISQLYAMGVENIDNIAEASIPDNVDYIDGSHNGQNYVAYTFYFKNSGESWINYTAEITISEATLGIENAMRLRLYEDGVPVVYAKEKSDQSGPEPGTQAFLTDKVIMNKRYQKYPPSKVTKYTVVLWLEGDDPECIDNIMGGAIKLQMHFSGEKVGEEKQGV